MLSVSCRHHDGFQQECLHILQSLAAHPSTKGLKRRQLSGDPLPTLSCLFKPKTGRDKRLRVFLWLRVASEKNESEMESLGFRKSFWPHFFSLSAHICLKHAEPRVRDQFRSRSGQMDSPQTLPVTF